MNKNRDCPFCNLKKIAVDGGSKGERTATYSRMPNSDIMQVDDLKNHRQYLIEVRYCPICGERLS